MVQNFESPALEASIGLTSLASRAASQFLSQFGRDPRWIVAAPGRVNLIGEHTDYNGGFVLPMAIERHVVLAADESDSAARGTTRLFSSPLDNMHEFAPDGIRPAQEKHWSNYIRGVVAGFQKRGIVVPALDVVIDSSVPLGGGLSSSAALEVATATLLEAIANQQLPPVEKALLCQKAEHEFAGMPCGIMDQFSSVMGLADHLMLLDCRSLELRHIPLTDPAVTVLIINSNVKHELTGSEYPTRRAQCQAAAQALSVHELRDATLEQLDQFARTMDATLFRRARHVIGEIARTQNAASAITAGQWSTVGELMYASHSSLQQDYEVSCAELDLLVEIMQSIGYDGGVWGSRMTGGGFGGCTVSLVRTGAVPAVAQQVSAEYQSRTGIACSVFASRPAAGPQVIQRS